MVQRRHGASRIYGCGLLVQLDYQGEKGDRASVLIFPFIITALVIELTPGPNMAWLALLSATKGRRAGFAAVAGIALGLFVIGLVAAYGLAELIAVSPKIAQILRLAGILYMLWLAWDAWPRNSRPVADDIVTPPFDTTHFRRGLLLNLLNPKAGLVFVSVLPEFVDPTKAALTQSLLLTTIYVAIATAVHLMIVMLAGLGERWFQSKERERRLRQAFAVLLVVIAIWLGLR
jgi:threonine/homoserine/homoserine lactone efflux protein